MNSLRGDVFNARESFLYEDDMWFGTLTDSSGKVVYESYQSHPEDDIGTQAKALVDLQREAEVRGARLEMKRDEDHDSWRRERMQVAWTEATVMSHSRGRLGE